MARKVNKKELFCLILVLVLASFFRLWRLDSIPPGLYPDEAMNANEAISSPGQIFYKANNGREGLFMNLIALSFKIFGISIKSLRIVSALVGIFTVLGIYFLAKELFGQSENSSRTIALLSSFFLATCFWHINFSRIVFRAILVPLISIFALYFLLKALKRRSVVYFAVSGMLFGLGFNTYIAFRIFFLVLPVLFLVWYKKTKRQKIEVSYFICALLIFSLPLMLYFFKNSEDFISRATGISIFTQENPIRALLESLVAHLLMFNFKGDPNWRHNIAGAPVLFWPTGILFLIGLFYSIKESINSIRNKKYSILDAKYLILVFWWSIMLLPGILTYEGIPHSLRCIGAIPPTFILAGLGGVLIFNFINKKVIAKIKGYNYYLIIFSAILMMLAFTLAQYGRYFELWAQEPEVQGAFTKHYFDIGHYLNSLSSEIKKYVIVNEPDAPLYGISIPAQTPMFIEAAEFGQPRAIYLRAEDLDKIKIDAEQTVIVPIYEGEIFNKLFERFPKGKIKQVNSLIIYEIKE